MSDTSKTVEYAITANPDQFTAAMRQAQAATKDAADKIKSSWADVVGHFKGAQSALFAVVAVFAGGAAFKETINAANKLNSESMGLAKALGITGAEASTLRTALNDVGADSETYIGAFHKFAKQLKTNEEGLQAMGLQTRDANGQLRDSSSLFTEALRTVGEYKPGLDQATASMTLFGKGIDDVLKLQKLNDEALDRARAKNKELGLTMTAEGVEASKKYKAAMNDVGDVFLAIKNVVGSALMPVFTRLSEWLAAIGPPAVFTFKVAIDALATALQGVVLVVKIVWNVLRALADPLFVLGGAIRKLVSGDMAGATADMMRIGSSWGNALSGAWDQIKADATRSWTEVKNLWAPGTEVATPGKGKRTMGEFKPKAEKQEKSQASEWETELSELKLRFQEQRNLEGSFQEFSKAQELAFWRDKIAITSDGSAENITVRRKLAELQLAIGREEFETELATLKSQGAAFKNNVDERIAILERESALVADRYGRESKHYAEAQKSIVAASREKAEQVRAIEDRMAETRRNAQLAELALQEQMLQQDERLQLVGREQVLAQQLQFEERRNAIALYALQQRMQAAENDPDRNPVELARIHAEMEAMEQQHQLRLQKIKGDLQATQLEPLVNTYKAAEQALGAAIQGILSRSMSLGQAMRTVWQGISSTIIGELSKILAKKAAAWAAEKALALAGIGTKAVEAGAGAASSVASIPYVGPILAIAALASVMGAVMSAKGSVPSAVMGFDIPAGLNPLTQLHEREMVLPAKQADVIRSLANTRDTAAAAASAVATQPVVNVHLNVNALDGASVKRVLVDNHHAVAEAVAAAVRANSLRPSMLP